MSSPYDVLAASVACGFSGKHAAGHHFTFHPLPDRGRTNGLGFWIALRAFGIDLPLSAGLFFQSCITLAVSAPSGPAFIGIYHAASEFVLTTLWGQDSAKALAFSVGLHISAFIPVTLIGLFCAYRLGLTLSRVARTEEEVEVAVERETGVDAEHPRKPAN